MAKTRGMLTITDLSLRVAGRLLIDHAHVQIGPGSRVGLVGRNGTGKSTLFRAIRGELAGEGGRSPCRRAGRSAAWRRRRPTAPTT